MRIQDLLNFETFITSISFSEEAIEVTFLEKREQGDTVMMARTMVCQIDNEQRAELYADLQDRMRDFIDWGYIELRNPPSEFTDSRNWAHSRMVGGHDLGDAE
jgi:hypothetical protein